jgi:uncharacterized protein YegP (UPF0339 family)
MPMSNKNDRWEFYQDARKKWRWRRAAANGRIIAASTEGYVKRSACVDNAKKSGFENSPAESTN